MSPLPRFTVNVMVGRNLTLVLNARDAQAAEDIATWLYQEHGDRFFLRHSESQFDCIVDQDAEVAS